LVDAKSDAYFIRARAAMISSKIDPIVSMDIFCRQPVFLTRGARYEVADVISEYMGDKAYSFSYTSNEFLLKSPRDPEKRFFGSLTGKYVDIAPLETYILGILSSCAGYSTAAKDIIDLVHHELGDHVKTIFMGARHVHPNVSSIMEREAKLAGFDSITTYAGMCEVNKLYKSSDHFITPAGTMPHALVLSCGSTIAAAEILVDRYPELPLVVLVDTLKDEVDEAGLAYCRFRSKLSAVRLDTPSERGGVTPGLVREVRSRLNYCGGKDVGIIISGGMNPEKIKSFASVSSMISGIGIGSHVSHAAPIDFTADIKNVDGIAVAKRGRLAGCEKVAYDKFLHPF